MRNTTRRDKHRRIIAQDQPPCHRCGRPINYEADHLHPDSFTIDHITPISRGGPDTLDNLRAAHRRCNIAAGNRYDNGVSFETERDW